MAKDDAPLKPKSMVSAPSSRVTIAFPFSNIRMEQSSDELRELAAIVTELAEHVAKAVPSPEADALADRARTVFTKLDH
jgi:hypothetical protein